MIGAEDRDEGEEQDPPGEGALGGAEPSPREAVGETEPRGAHSAPYDPPRDRHECNRAGGEEGHREPARGDRSHAEGARFELEPAREGCRPQTHGDPRDDERAERERFAHETDPQAPQRGEEQERETDRVDGREIAHGGSVPLLDA